MSVKPTSLLMAEHRLAGLNADMDVAINRVKAHRIDMNRLQEEKDKKQEEIKRLRSIISMIDDDQLMCEREIRQAELDMDEVDKEIDFYIGLIDALQRDLGI